MNLIESTVDGVPFIAIHGELDRGSSQPALDLLDRTFASSPQPENLLVDLTNCTFLDSGGLDVLMYGATLLPASGWLGIVGASENTTRILEIVGFTGRENVRFFASREDAVAAIPREEKLLHEQER